MQIGRPNVRGSERLAAWKIDDIRDRKSLFLPGGVIGTDAGDILGIIGAVVVSAGGGESLKLQFQQSTRNAHLAVSRQIEKLRARHAVRGFGMHVRAQSAFGGLLDKVGRRQDGRLGPVTMQFWLQLADRNRPTKLAPIDGHIYGKKRATGVRLGKVRPGSLFGPAMFCPDWWCPDPTCHSHWHWFPGVPATTSCGGLCVVGGPCQCWQTGLPSGWMTTCTGIKLCWC